MSGAAQSQVYPLADSQLRAVEPEDTVWLGASAGTGKTQVLTARVLRLLLREGVQPSQILCLTFTKAGAAEMTTRINQVLANWVRMEEVKLGGELANIGAPNHKEACARARTLFASVLDAPGGGLRIDTIHAFSQWLLGAFPEEAGLAQGARAMEDHERVLLLRDELAGLMIEAEERGDAEVLGALESLSLRLMQPQIETFLLRCASAHEAWEGAGPWAQGDLRPQVLRLLGLPVDASEVGLIELCGDDQFDCDALELCLSAYRQWDVKTGRAGREVIADWLAAGPQQRLERLANLHKTLFTAKNTIKDVGSLSKLETLFEDAAQAVLDCALAIRDRQTLLTLAEFLTPALTLGRAFARRWDAAKAREGLIDFDDQIRMAARLLGNSDLAQWIGFKLDRRFDHVLVDEAQDTNAAQWDIIFSLTEEFFAGTGQHDDKVRTLFVVGDYKQAIFGFQGTSPENFRRAKERVKTLLDGLVANADRTYPGRNMRGLQDLGLKQSYRTARPILEFVDKAIETVGHEAIGLDEPVEAHAGLPINGLVTLWNPVIRASADPEISGGEAGDDGEADEGWLSDLDRELADRIARQVRLWLDPAGPGFPLAKSEAGRAGAGDIMVLVRRRAALAALIVARLHAAGVKVAGVDRLRLGAPLAVKDLVAALRFAAQPLDELNLAALLVSPLLGWSQQDLLDHGYRAKGVNLWLHLRGSRDPLVTETSARLLDLLARADYQTPQALLHWLLIGPWQGRERLVARLGREANDPIDELVNAAHAFAMTDVPSLAGFLHWFDAGDGELKREAESKGDFVRVMTVHGAKGLQAPIIIMADATGDPQPRKALAVDIEEQMDSALDGMMQRHRLPLPPLASAARVGLVRDAAEEKLAEDMKEHWRLLYVAMTRAEEALFIGGTQKGKELPKGCWYNLLSDVIGDAAIDDDIWLARREWGTLPRSSQAGQIAKAQAQELPLLPPWAERPIAAEPRPPRPLAPSSLGEEKSADPPWPPGTGIDAARRGVLIHRLLERLPELDAASREGAALHWLERNAGDMGEAVRREMALAALNVLAQGEWAELFAPGALAEVPIAALVGDVVVAGTIDRLLIKPDRLRLVDFKTARRPPRSLDDVPRSTLRQMSAYAAALEVSFPGRRIEAAVLYTSAPMLIEIPADLLAAHKPGLSTAE